jgi:hypothetical protein
MNLWLDGEIYGHCPQCKISYSAKTKKELLLHNCDCGNKIVVTQDEIEDRTYSIGYEYACGYKD